jgi:hypothetical protein
VHVDHALDARRGQDVFGRRLWRTKRREQERRGGLGHDSRYLETANPIPHDNLIALNEMKRTAACTAAASAMNERVRISK